MAHLILLFCLIPLFCLEHAKHPMPDTHVVSSSNILYYSDADVGQLSAQTLIYVGRFGESIVMQNWS